jgi:hypothetical protein
MSNHGKIHEWKLARFTYNCDNPYKTLRGTAFGKMADALYGPSGRLMPGPFTDIYSCAVWADIQADILFAQHQDNMKARAEADRIDASRIKYQNVLTSALVAPAGSSRAEAFVRAEMERCAMLEDGMYQPRVDHLATYMATWPSNRFRWFETVSETWDGVIGPREVFLEGTIRPRAAMNDLGTEPPNRVTR